jgi:uncharacterized protein YndB with AHSA1/START domain
MKDKVELEATYPHSPELVWQALTDPAALSQWLLPADFKPLIGFRFRLDRPNADAIKGKVIEVEEGRLLAYTWDDGEAPEPSVVCWTLNPTGDGTRLRLEHRYVETPEVNCIPIDNYFNWSYAIRYSLPGLLVLLSHRLRSPQPPIVYVSECRETIVPKRSQELDFARR